jgi:hypothetical protein
MARDATPRNYSELFLEAFAGLPAAGMPIFIRVNTAIDMVIRDIPMESSDRSAAIEATDLAASKMLGKHLSEIRDAKTLKDAFATLNSNPKCVEVLLRSSHNTNDVIQSAMEAAAASTTPRSIQSFEILLKHSRNPNYGKILAEALKIHDLERNRNSIPFMRSVLKQMWPDMPPLPDQGVLACSKAVAGKTLGERAEGAVAAYDALQQLESGKYDTSCARKSLAEVIVSGVIPEKPGKFQNTMREIYRLASKIAVKAAKGITSATLARFAAAVPKFIARVSATHAGRPTKEQEKQVKSLAEEIIKAVPEGARSKVTDALNIAARIAFVGIKEARARQSARAGAGSSRPSKLTSPLIDVPFTPGDTGSDRGGMRR